MKIVKYLILTLTFIYSAVTIQAESYLSHTMRTTILVSDPEHTLDLISSWADESGGYYLYRSVNRIVIRVQSKDIGKLRSYLEEISEAILDVSIETEDLRERLVALRSGIKSREEILQKNLSYLDRTDVKGTLAIEQEIKSLLGEIEGLKGQLRNLEVNRKFATGEVNLNFMEETLPVDITSSFEWINSIDFYSFIEEGF